MLPRPPHRADEAAPRARPCDTEEVRRSDGASDEGPLAAIPAHWGRSLPIEPVRIPDTCMPVDAHELSSSSAWWAPNSAAGVPQAARTESASIFSDVDPPEHAQHINSR